MKAPNNQFKVLILGGYGTFGRRIAKALCLKQYQVIINGRNSTKAHQLMAHIKTTQSKAMINAACFDAHTDLGEKLKELKVDLVIHTCGPFQGQNTGIAQTVIESKCHYIDLSDSRQYVQNIQKLNSLALSQGVTAITAASTVPALSSAALTHLQQEFNIAQFKHVHIGISPGQKTDRGIATTRAVLSYIGKVLPEWQRQTRAYGWQDTYYQHYPNIRNRLMGNCEAPDLDSFKSHFNIDDLRFSAGMESKLLHGLIWLCSWLVRLRIPLNLTNKATYLLKASRLFDFFGTEDGGMHINVSGLNQEQSPVNKTWFIEAKNNDGPQIPAVPAVILAEKILNQQLLSGVHACVKLITLDEYLSQLQGFEIQTTIS